MDLREGPFQIFFALSRARPTQCSSGVDRVGHLFASNARVWGVRVHSTIWQGESSRWAARIWGRMRARERECEWEGKRVAARRGEIDAMNKSRLARATANLPYKIHWKIRHFQWNEILKTLWTSMSGTFFSSRCGSPWVTPRVYPNAMLNVKEKK